MKSKAKKQIIIEKSIEIINSYDIKITLRQLYYRLVTFQIIENTISQYKRLSAIMVEARKKGQVPQNIFEDRLRSSDLINDEPPDKEYLWDDYLEWFKNEMENYQLPRWFNQANKVFIVLEKDALSSVFLQICNPLGITLIVNRGYNSYTQLREIANNISYSNDEDRNLIFLTFGDFDPTGKDIMRNFQDQLREMGVVGQFIEIALNQKQIEEYQIPPAPTKKTDSRSKKFIQKYGDNTVELDGLDPDILQQLIKESVEKIFEGHIYEKNKTIQKQYSEYLEKKLEGLTK